MTTLSPATTSIALKEWDVVCRLLVAGQQSVLLRKGGIHEPRGQGFRLEHDRFLLYPNAEHQSAVQLKPHLHPLLDQADPPPAESGLIRIPGYCDVVEVIEVAEPERLRRLEPLTGWTQALFDMRIAYKPERPNYVLVVRAFRFSQPVTVPYHKTYAGCRSWVPLKDEVPLTPAVSALADAAFEAQRQAVRAML